MDQHDIIKRIEGLRAESVPEGQIGQRIADELAKEAIGYTATEVRKAVAEAEEIYAAHVFVQRHPEWKAIATDTNIELLQRRARELNDGGAYDLGALEAAYYDLAEEGAFETPEPEPQPVAATPAPEPALPFKKSGHGGMLTVDAATRAELNRLSLDDLKRRANADRWANMDPKRASRLKAGFTVI
jgi:hypothetical protein